MRMIAWIYTLVLGASLGSFVNVLVARLPHQLSVVRPRSRCPQCLTPIAWYDNIPILSYLLLLGRCRFCKKSIPMRYVLIEVLTTGLFAALLMRFDVHWPLLIWWPLTVGLMAVTFLDIDYWWVPDIITYPLILWVLAVQCVANPAKIGSTLWGLLPALMLWGMGWLYAWISKKEGMGFGDIKLLALLGLALGLSDALTLLMLASIQGAILGAIILATGGHRDAQSRDAQKPAALAEDDWVPDPHAVPFGPFLTLAAFEVVLFPQIFGQWHMQIADFIIQHVINA